MAVTTRLCNAMNAHDREGFLDCFHEGHRSEQPIHTGRGFGGHEQVRARTCTCRSMTASPPDCG